jgi:hypothetical protein
MKSNLRTLALIVALWYAGPGCAAEDPCLQAPKAEPAEAVLAKINLRMSVQNCYDIKAHTPDQLKDVSKLLEKANGAEARADRKQLVAGLLEAMREWMVKGLSDATLRDELRGKVSEARVVLISAEASNDVVNPTSWRIVQRPSDSALTSKVFDKTDFTAPVRSKCTAQATNLNDCATAIADLEGVIRSHTVVESALLVVRKDELSDLADLFSKRANMWDAYRTEARPQYPWEWLLNSALYKDDRLKDQAGNPKGPANLPNGQTIFLHPGVGLERFNPKETNQSSDNPTLYVEWIGYNRLKWSYGEGKLLDGFGVSIVGVYAPRQDVSHWSHGLMFWVSNKYGLAVTRNSQGTSVMVSMEVGELYRDKLNQVNTWMGSSLSSK